MIMRTRIFNVTALALALGLTMLAPVRSQAMTPDGAPEGAAGVSPDKDIVGIAVAGNFTTLVAAVKAAGLVETLQSDGPFTVFAPTDEAFAKLPEGTLENLLKPENKDQLIAILTYHVVAGEVTAGEVVKLDSAETVQGAALQIRTDEEGVMINDARVIKTDIDASNGVVHVIDTVLLPPSSN